MRMSIIREGLIGISFQYKSINLEKQGRYLTVGIPSIVSWRFFPSALLLICDSGTNVDFNVDLLLKLYFIYFLVLFMVSTYQNKSFKIGYLSVVAVWKQFYGYGLVL
jgi:hypothetical protein